jgi:hypothetical protein
VFWSLGCIIERILQHDAIKKRRETVSTANHQNVFAQLRGCGIGAWTPQAKVFQFNLLEQLRSHSPKATLALCGTRVQRLD